MCQIKREVQIKAKGMFLDLVICLCTNMIIQVLETVTKEGKEKTWLCAANSCSTWHTGLSGALGWFT
jgi:glycopeptide antibiotics resistance protein